MKIKYFISFIFLVFYQYASATNTEKDERCKQIGMKIGKMKLDYEFNMDTTTARLDSALSLIDSISCDCPKYYPGLVSTKLQILCLKKDYAKTIDFVKTLDEKRIYPLNKTVLLNRFYAMQSQNNGDTITRNKYICAIVTELRDSLSNHSQEIDSVLHLSKVSDIMKYKRSITLIQYYYYRAQIEDVDKIQIELNSLQKRIKGNEEFFNDILKDYLKNDFMTFFGM